MALSRVFPVSKEGNLYFIFSVVLSRREVVSKEVIARTDAPEVAPLAVAAPVSDPDIGSVGRDTVGPTVIIARLPVASRGIYRVTYTVTQYLSPSWQVYYSSWLYVEGVR